MAAVVEMAQVALEDGSSDLGRALHVSRLGPGDEDLEVVGAVMDGSVGEVSDALGLEKVRGPGAERARLRADDAALGLHPALGHALCPLAFTYVRFLAGSLRMCFSSERVTSWPSCPFFSSESGLPPGVTRA